MARSLQFAPGTILVFDRGYTDYDWFWRLSLAGVFFVTRMRWNAYYEVIEARPLPSVGAVLSDELVRVGYPRYSRPCSLRRIVVCDPESGEMVVFLTNHLQFAARTVAQIYRDRWQIEIFFKALKQSLRVKTFVGTSANALKTQIWTALLAMLLLKYLQLRARFGWSLSNLVALLRQQLFVYRDLFSWLHQPFEPPPLLAVGFAQMALDF